MYQNLKRRKKTKLSFASFAFLYISEYSGVSQAEKKWKLIVNSTPMEAFDWSLFRRSETNSFENKMWKQDMLMISTLPVFFSMAKFSQNEQIRFLCFVVGNDN